MLNSETGKNGVKKESSKETLISGAAKLPGPLVDVNT
jgi:hypothetical protein